jgi:hypothetical protein
MLRNAEAESKLVKQEYVTEIVTEKSEMSMEEQMETEQNKIINDINNVDESELALE